MRETSRRVFLTFTASVVWFFGAQAPATAEGEGTNAEPISVCSLVTKEDVERITGRQSLMGFTPMLMPGGTGALCDSDVVRVIVFSGENSERAWEELLKNSGRAQEQRYPISDLGDKAYALYPTPRNENEYPTALVVVPAALHTLAVSVRAQRGLPRESAQPQAIELARIILAKLP
jgi:hypothetical protein